MPQNHELFGTGRLFCSDVKPWLLRLFKDSAVCYYFAMIKVKQSSKAFAAHNSKQ